LKVRFIINPAAGSGAGAEVVADSISEALGTETGFFEVKASRFRGDAHELAKEAVRNGYDTVFAMGGDGTINEVASALVSTNTALGIIPAGSGNGLARALKIPFNKINAVKVLKTGIVRSIDAGQMNDRYFFSTAGAGFDAVVSSKYAEWAKTYKKRGILPYVPITFAAYFGYKPGIVKIKHDGGVIECSPLMLTVANTREFGGNAVIAPKAVPDDGLLDLCLVEGVGFFGTLFCGIKLLRGTIDSSKHYRAIKTSFVEVEREGASPAQIDGEAFFAPAKLSFKVLPGALKVWTPA